jgi:hypothetical protein
VRSSKNGSNKVRSSRERRSSRKLRRGGKRSSKWKEQQLGTGILTLQSTLATIRVSRRFVSRAIK